MVTYDEYLTYFGCFRIHMTNTNYRLRDLVVNFLEDNVIVDDYKIFNHGIHIKIDKNEIISNKDGTYCSYGNVVHYKIKHALTYFSSNSMVFKDSGYQCLSFPDIDLKEIRFSILGVTFDELLLLFRQIYNDYRLRTETFSIYDLKITYL